MKILAKTVRKDIKGVTLKELICPCEFFKKLKLNSTEAVRTISAF